VALDSAKPRPDTSPLSDTLEQAPDSSPLRVSLNTTLESGIPPARPGIDWEPEQLTLTLADGVERLDFALAGVTRTQANLGLLMRGLKHLAAGAASARDANAELLHELDALRAHLARGHDEEQAMRFRMSQLEQLLDVIRHESGRERAFLVEQQDLFLVEIMNDHDRQVGELQRLIRETTTRKADSAELTELTAQRDQAREYATRCERERDLAWQELAAMGGGQRAPGSAPAATLRRPPSSPSAAEAPLAPVATGKSGPTAIGCIALRAVQVPAQSPSEPSRSATGYSRPGSGEDSTE
jgi:hypothetical protein